MNLPRFQLGLSIVLLLAFVAAGCSNDETNPISAFQPEVVNNTDAFQFQITGASNVTTNLTYQWENTGTQASIDHSTAMTDGSAVLTIFDADTVQVYTNGLVASGTHQTAVGTAGTWTIQISFVNFDGTANFRAEKL
jgi:hypothetical protein